MSVQHAAFYVDGMSCSACESRISKVLSSISGVTKSKVTLQGGKVSVEFDDKVVLLDAIKSAIEKEGYPVRGKKPGLPWISLGLGLLLAGLYLALSAAGIFSSLPRLDANAGYAMLFAVGLLTSVHCIAMCGGIALTQSLNAATDNQTRKTSKAKILKRLLPGLKYNGGRVISYTLIGGLAGLAGSAFSFSTNVKALITGSAGILMVLFALRMLGLPGFKFSFIHLVPSRFRNAGPFAVGLLNGLIPCGPLQTMQLYALGTGNPVSGAVSMFLFSVGTIPLMLLFGSGVAFLPRKLAPPMLKASAVFVLFLGAVTFVRAAALTGFIPQSAGITLNSPSQPAQKAQSNNPSVAEAADRKPAVPVSTVTDGVQTVITEFKNGRYIPFSVQSGIPLKWIIRIKEEELNGCNETLIVPSYNITMPLLPGDNVIEFTPTSTGTIAYSCWMGIIRSRITVTPNNIKESL